MKTDFARVINLVIMLILDMFIKYINIIYTEYAGADLEGGAPGARPPVRPYM